MLRQRFLIMFPLGILLAGCADMGAVFRTPEIELPDRYSLVAPVQAPSRDEVNWWRNFDDPVLDQLVAQGMAGNLTVAEAQARLREAEADARREGVALSGNGRVDATTATRSDDRFDVGLDAQINLAGEARHRSRAAQARFEAAQLNEVEARRTILSEMAQAYTNMRFLQSTRVTREQDLRSRRRTMRDIQKQLDLGEATRLDLLRAQSLMAETRAEIPRIESDIIQQRNRISTLLGVPVGALTLDLGYKGQQPLPKRVADIGVPADLLRARPDIRRAERLYAAAVSDVSAAHAARYPSLRLSGLITTPFGSGASSESLLAGLVVPVFSQPALAANEDATVARVEQAYLQWRVAVLEAVEEVENAQVLLQSALAATKASREAVELNRQSLALSRELVVSGGNITVLDVLDRERALSASRTSLAQNQRDVAAGYIALRVALGRGHPLVQDEPEPDTEVAGETVTQAIITTE
ncbi:Cation efflux system protein CusC precursor [Roseovarius litorisediminis]|uniref:Cation efflux system protein CusC n=2 Tax=Roseovarius litorisediminis TaxID=1312363 RepID=A0A1Y5T7U0_9RHOB|nr:Cation efflux system protein CusC precursor [Roseovarius litorisediminis]